MAKKVTVAIFSMVTCGCERIACNHTVSDRPIAVFQEKLLNVAFETAASIPIAPHIKDRSRMQQFVISTCLDMGQPTKALVFIEKIDNWRRNLCYADLAFYYAQHNCTDKAKQYLDMAGQFGEEDQQWRIDRIKEQIAKTNILLQQNKTCKLNNLTENKSDEVKSMINSKDSFDEQLKALDSLLGSEDFDILKNTMHGYAQLFNQFYADKEKRLLIEEKIRTSSQKLPGSIKIDLFIELAKFASDHKDRHKTIELIDQTETFADACQWPIEHRIEIVTKLAKLRFLAGDVKRAKADIDAAAALFYAQKNEILDIYRARTLRPLAEAYQVMNETKKALFIYKKVVDAGIENLNSRPRAEDLTATCCSMALHAVEPDDKLWMMIHHVYEGLGEPW